MRRIEYARLKIGQQRKSHGHVAVPEGKLAGPETLIQAESQGIEIWAEVAKKGNLLSENDVLAKPENHRSQDDKRGAIGSIFDRRLVRAHKRIEQVLQIGQPASLAENLGRKKQKRGGSLDLPLFHVANLESTFALLLRTRSTNNLPGAAGKSPVYTAAESM